MNIIKKIMSKKQYNCIKKQWNWNPLMLNLSLRFLKHLVVSSYFKNMLRY